MHLKNELLFPNRELALEMEAEFFIHDGFCSFFLCSFNPFELHVSKVDAQMAGALMVLHCPSVVQNLARSIARLVALILTKECVSLSLRYNRYLHLRWSHVHVQTTSDQQADLEFSKD